jgi:hypothetical protein
MVLPVIKPAASTTGFFIIWLAEMYGMAGGHGNFKSLVLE